MFRIDHATAAAVMPEAGEQGDPGYFTPGNPGTGTPATVVTADFLNAIQEEICSVIEAAGEDLDKENPNQLLAALQTMFNTVSFGSVQVFDASDTFIVPAGVTRVSVEVWGGGGGGGGQTNYLPGGGGGGGGGYAWGLFDVTPEDEHTVTIGAGGVGGAINTTNSGTAGGTSSFGSLISASGGNPGGASSGGNGGAGTGGAENLTGARGQRMDDDTSLRFHSGGWSPRASGPAGPYATGNAPGGGGGGGNNGAAAGSGAAGRVIVRY